MSTRTWQVVGAIVAGIASAGAAVITNLLTERWTWALWVGLGALVLVGLGGQLLALGAPGANHRAGVHGGGPGSIVIGRDNRGTISMAVDPPHAARPSSPDTVVGRAGDNVQ